MGDGRHRTDPGGHRRYLVAAGGVVIVLVLLCVGGYALYSVLTAESASSGTGASPAGTGSAGEKSAHTAARDSASSHRSSGHAGSRSPSSPGSSARAPSGRSTLALKVTGPRCYVSVKLPGGDVLLNKTLHHGDVRRFDQPELKVTVGNQEAVQVLVNGEPRAGGGGSNERASGAGSKSQKGLDTFKVSRSSQ